MPKPIDITVIIPTRRGGALLERVARAVLGQRASVGFELLLVDSGSPPQEIERLEGLGARVERVDPESFDHGATRDHGARLARGRILVFLNQDALPVGEEWLEGLTAPFERSDPPAAVQGAIREFPDEDLERDGRRRFFWDSGGPRFYFTRESRDWIARHGGIGFSTVHCAIARAAWERIPFGTAPILEDKLWQQRAVAAGLELAAVDEGQALVWHSHDYDLRALLRRCASEGFGWRRLGERYRLSTALGDATRREVWREWSRGRSRDEITGPAELIFPVARALALWWGKPWARRVLH